LVSNNFFASVASSVSPFRDLQKPGVFDGFVMR
jgi:hypothetical protein